MIVWLWDAPGPARTGRGVSGDQAVARRAAEACLRSGQASDARVEEALAVLGTDAMANITHAMSAHDDRARRRLRLSSAPRIHRRPS